MDLTGIVLKRRYCILEQIGGGGQGSLYLARDIELGCFRAIKELPLEQKREAKLLRLLEHPHIPAMIDYVERAEHCYLVMEYIRGKSLAQWMREGRCFSAEEILKMAAAVAEVLAYLHSQKPPLYYGDLKPANMMLNGSGQLFLVDFGSTVPENAVGRVPCTGTRGYAAPEQLQGKMGKTSDVYALGKTVQALMGRRWLFTFLRMPGLVFFVRKCCRRNETRRYQDMEAVGAALSRIRMKQGKGRFGAGVSVTTALALFAIGAAMLPAEGQEDFWAELTAVTDAYYQEPFLQNEDVMQRKISGTVQEEIRRMLETYQGKEREYLLLLLDANGSLCSDGTDADTVDTEATEASGEGGAEKGHETDKGEEQKDAEKDEVSAEQKDVSAASAGGGSLLPSAG